jgi:diguanylate cyclase (GGDEF)-like protein/putative nucleotidyltransferase with HDIG domain
VSTNRRRKLSRASSGDRGRWSAVAGYIEAARAAERVGQRHLARAHYEDALRALSSGGEPPTATTILRWIAGSYFSEANHAAAEDCLTTAIATAEAWGDDVAVAYGINMLGVFRWQQGELDEAVRLYNDARERAVHLGDGMLAAMTAQNLGVISNIRGDFSRALEFYQAALADYRSMGLVRDVCIALNNLGMVYTDMERWDEAELVYQEAIELVRDLREVGLRVQIEVNVVEMWVARREFARAREAADAAMELALQLGEAHIPGDAYRLLGVIERESGDLVRAESMLQHAADVAAARQDLLLLAETSREQADVHRRQGRNRETLQALNRAHQLFTQLRARRDLADVDRQTTHLEGEFIDVVRRWGESIEAKDRYTQGHCERVADLACALAERSGFDERTMFWFRIGALLHDVGKLIIPAEVLNKPAKLDDDEWALMRRHPEAGVELLAGIDFPWDIRPLIESHHERWDGRGYPHGLAGEAIPLTARILCLADVFDALTSQRSYKQSMSVVDAMDVMRRDVGRAFDPGLFDEFERVIAEREGGRRGANEADAAQAAARRPSRDDLTQLPLRRACTAASTRLLAARRRDAGVASLLYVRVADLEAVRQRLGQARADDLLATVASILRRVSRRVDVLARYGADDFVLLLSDANTEQALGVAGRVRAQLTDTGAPTSEAASIAIGIATAPEHGDSLDSLVAAARSAAESQPEHATRALALAQSAADPPRPAVERFVGRVAELRRLEQMFDASLRGDARIMSVVGRDGIGKTTLVSRLMLDARRRGAAHVLASCHPSSFPTPYAPWIDVIEALRAQRAVPERRWSWLPRLVPSLAGVQRSLRLADEGVTAPETSLAGEICELLVAAAVNRPLVIVIDDVEHADHGSWDVFERLAARLSSERVLLCLTTTEAHASVARSRFASCRRHYELRLQDLTAEDMRSWIGDLFADPSTADACSTYLAASKTGTPLSSTHALHALVDDGRLAYRNGTWRVMNAAALSSAQPPTSAATVFANRLDALTPKTRAIMGELGVLGDGFELDVALAAGIGDEAELLDAIDEALTAAILREEDGAEPGAAFAFAHRALSEAARATVDAMRLHRVHERIARGLEQVRPVALFQITEHFDCAGLSERAFEYALLAAARAVSVHAYGDAAAAYDIARKHITTPAQRNRVEELVTELPLRLSRVGVA